MWALLPRGFYSNVLKGHGDFQRKKNQKYIVITNNASCLHDLNNPLIAGTITICGIANSIEQFPVRRNV